MCAVSLALKNENTVPAVRHVRPIKSKTEFHGHVEPWNTARCFDPRQVVNRKLGFLDQFYDRAQPALIWNCKSSLDLKPELGQADNVGEVKILKDGVIRNIEENGLDAPSGHAISLRQFEWLPVSARLSLPSLSGAFCQRGQTISAGLGCS